MMMAMPSLRLWMASERRERLPERSPPTTSTAVMRKFSSIAMMRFFSTRSCMCGSVLGADCMANNNNKFRQFHGMSGLCLTLASAPPDPSDRCLHHVSLNAHDLGIHDKDKVGV